MTPWKAYEKHILTRFKKKWPTANLQTNKQNKGLHSKVNRPVDIFVQGSLVGEMLTGAIECNFFNRKIDVSIIDRFIGFLEDIEADFGIVITNNGYTKGVVNRAQTKRIKIDIVKFIRIDNYEFEWDSWKHV